MREGESDRGGSRYENKRKIPSGPEAVLAAYKDLTVFFFYIQLVIIIMLQFLKYAYFFLCMC